MKTYGFDYAYGISIGTLNAAIATSLANVSMPVVFNTTDPESGTTIALNATLAPWQIVSGGGGDLLHLNITFSDGYLELAGAFNGSFDVSDVVALVEIQLGWVGPGTPQQEQGGGTVTQLTFAPATVDPANPGYVSVIGITDPDSGLSTVAKGLLKSYVANALVSNQANVQYILANTNPVPAGLGSWLRPVRWAYFYADSVKSLCYLCMMSRQAMPTLAFDNTAFSQNDCALLISQAQFFANVVLPGVQAAFPGGTFSVATDNENSTLTNQGDFDLGDISASALTVTTSDAGNGLKVYAAGGGPLKFFFGLSDLPGASYSWNVTSTNVQQFTNGTLSFVADPNPVINQDHTIHWYDWVLLVAVGITDVAGLVSAIYDGIEGFHDQVEKVGVATINTEVQSASGGAVANLQNVVDWKLGVRQLSIASAGLNGPLYAQGNFA